MFFLAVPSASNRLPSVSADSTPCEHRKHEISGSQTASEVTVKKVRDGAKPELDVMKQPFSFHFCSNLFVFDGNSFMSGRIIFFLQLVATPNLKSNPASQNSQRQKIIVSVFDFKSLPPPKRGSAGLTRRKKPYVTTCTSSLEA